MPMGAGTTCLGKAMSGRPMALQTRALIPMDTETGCLRPDLATYGHQDIRGDISLTSAEHGTFMTALAGVGHLDWAAARRGGV